MIRTPAPGAGRAAPGRPPAGTAAPPATPATTSTDARKKLP